MKSVVVFMIEKTPTLNVGSQIRTDLLPAFHSNLGNNGVNLHLNLIQDLQRKLIHQKTTNPSPEFRFVPKLWIKLKCKYLPEMDQI